MSLNIVWLDNKHKEEKTMFVLVATATREQLEKDGVIERYEKNPRSLPTIDVSFLSSQQLNKKYGIL